MGREEMGIGNAVEHIEFAIELRIDKLEIIALFVSPGDRR